MAGTPLESSSIPLGAVSPEPARSYGESMEDAVPQTTRKRPRLDSGSGSRETMSTDHSPAAHPTPELAAASSAAVSAADNDEEAQASLRPASRVTINMKSPSLPGTTDSPVETQPEQSSGDPAHSSGRPPIPSGASSTEAGAQSSTAISISSSPAQSPEIEVAEVEDIDQDPHTSNWRPLGEALRDHTSADVIQLHEPLSLTESFPKLRGNLDPRESVEEIVNMIEKGRTPPFTGERWLH